MKVQIAFLLDRSGSMELRYTDTIGGFNAFIREQAQDTSTPCTFSLYQFSDKFEVTYEGKDISEVEPLDRTTFNPGGQTALLDAIGDLIARLEASPTSDDTKRIVVILTDGEENVSKRHTYKDISSHIERLQGMNYSFVFLGADQDAIKTGCALGVPAHSSLSFRGDKMCQTCTVLSSAVTRSRRNDEKVTFTPVDRTQTQ